MEQLSQHTAAAFMEAEQILATSSSCDGKARDKPVADGKENSMIAVDNRQMVDSPSSLLVCPKNISHNLLALQYANVGPKP
jgi:hypothetical protein